MAAQADTAINLEGVEITASFKVRSDMQTMPLASSSFYLKDIERQQIRSISDFAATTPNLHIPDYGSSTTSSIYVRGMGSRIDNPAVGMYVDGVPFLNKSSFDEPLWDVRRIDVLRGPQSTLYGRNTIGGIISVSTLSPFDYTGTRVSLEAGNGQMWRASASSYLQPTDHFGLSAGLSIGHTGGFFSNEFTNDRCDWRNSGSARLRLMWRSNDWIIDNTLSVNLTDEGGYAYAQFDTTQRITLPVAYNDECGYRRLHIADGLVAQRNMNAVTMKNVLSMQYLNDDLRLDQDFTTRSLFTLQQTQKEYTVSDELAFQNADKSQMLNWLAGVSTFFKHNRMNAPVMFKTDGIHELILDNANRGLQTVFPNDSLSFKEDEFLINSRFTTPTVGLAAYGQTELRLSDFLLTAGLRADYERIAFDYANNGDVHYNFSYTMRDFRLSHTDISGNEHQTFVELMPKLSLQYVVGEQNIYLSVARGFKAGGYNSQMFSDILQNQMKADLMGALGVYFSTGTEGYPIDKVIKYKPEHNWNFELGAHFRSSDQRITADVALFSIFCTDQQLTVFPSGKGTGRMMTNAGRSRSVGAEAALAAKPCKTISLSASYGYTNATFTDYDNGLANFSDNYLPYVPQHTVSAAANYERAISNNLINSVMAQLRYTGAGRIYWDEANSVWQDYYSQLSATVGVNGSVWNLQLWAKNITNQDYRWALTLR